MASQSEPARRTDARRAAPSLMPAPLPALLGLTAAAGCLVLLALAWPLIAGLAVLAVEWVLG